MTLERAVRRYISVARPILLEHFPQNSCIQSTRACVDVFRRLGFAARPQAVQLVVTNPADKTCYVSGLSAQAKVEAKAASANFLDLSDGGGWDGHLIALIGDSWFIDSALDQASVVTPLPKEPFAFRMPESFNFAANGISIDGVTDDGTAIEIQYAIADNDGYAYLDAWKVEGILPVATIIRAMRGEKVKKGELPMYVVYRDPKDHKWPYVVRRWTLKSGEMYCDRQLWAVAKDQDGLRTLRADLERTGCARLNRQLGDDPAIMEVWV